jgi:MoaA/NifB/PqqE/SkfB family radical SAM enzyme
MYTQNSGELQIGPHNEISLPAEIAAQLGLAPGSRVNYSIQNGELRFQRPASHLARIYLEPTNICNLNCSTCMRHVWDEPLGYMSQDIFEKVLAALNSYRQVYPYTPLPGVFFGGFGEPLFHPEILDMIRRVRAMGAPVELITNGVLLDLEITNTLIETGVDTLWVSIDGATPQSYQDVRLGDALPLVLENLARLRDRRFVLGSQRPQLGIAFVAMRRNIQDLPEILQTGIRLGASRFSISNVLAHTPELRQEILYAQSQYNGAYSPERLSINLPRMDLTPETARALAAAFQAGAVSLAGESLTHQVNVCPFIQKGSLSVRWDGAVSPCLPLLHTHSSFLDNHPRQTQAHAVGSLREHSLLEIWNLPDYLAFREKLQAFDFSPCVFCNTCEFSEHNQEDCYGNTTPTCGGCLWAQGLIQCP